MIVYSALPWLPLQMRHLVLPSWWVYYYYSQQFEIPDYLVATIYVDDFSNQSPYNQYECDPFAVLLSYGWRSTILITRKHSRLHLAHHFLTAK